MLILGLILRNGDALAVFTLTSKLSHAEVTISGIFVVLNLDALEIEFSQRKSFTYHVSA